MIFTSVTLVACLATTISTGLIALKFYRDWHLRVSSVRWLFFFFFAYLCIYGAARFVYYLFIVSLPSNEFVDSKPNENGPYTRDQLDRLGVHASVHLACADTPWVAASLIIGDTAHFGYACWVMPLAYELSKIASKSMDRGAKKESEVISFYSIYGHFFIAVFLVAQVTLAIIEGGYTYSVHIFLIVIYFIQIVTMIYMMALLVLLKIKGREVETIHGKFMTSPVYTRLKHIVVVYALLAFQFQVSSILVYAVPGRQPMIIGSVGASLILYNCVGLALAVTTGCSQTCVIKFCSQACCISDEMVAQLTTLQPPINISIHAPELDEEDVLLLNPVFVFTDIESSSAIWAIGDGRIMQAATDIHDTILRSLLSKYRGYEITTAGDSFQLAFHTIKDAVSYCLEVQLELLAANWPKELDGLVPATKKKRSGRRVIFKGLRVRMGIHDAQPSDGKLAHDFHAVTGKITYTGASEVIANEVGDLGAGGQILITRRVADWLFLIGSDEHERLNMEFVLDRVGVHEIPQIATKLELFQILPLGLSRRKRYFPSVLLPRPASSRTIALRTAPSLQNMSNQNLHNLLRTSATNSVASQDNNTTTNGSTIPLPTHQFYYRSLQTPRRSSRRLMRFEAFDLMKQEAKESDEDAADEEEVVDVTSQTLPL